MKQVMIVTMLVMFLVSACSSVDTDPNDLEENQVHLNEEEAEENSGEFIILEELPDLQPDLCASQEINLITDLKVYQTPDLPEPAPRTAFIDPVFGTCIIRVTDRQDDIGNLSDPSLGLKNEYARVQSFNADGSLLIVRSIESFWYLYDANSLLPLGELPVSIEPRWDSQNPYLLYYTDETRLMSYDIGSGEIEELRDFSDDFPGTDLTAVWTRYEGSPSYDTRYWGLIAQDSDWEPTAFLIYDREEDTLVTREIPRGVSIDNVTISPLGNYLLASFDDYCEHGQLGSDADPCGLMVYDHDLENGRGLLRIIGHYDTALDQNNREVILYQDIDTDTISMLDLDSGEVTSLLPIDFSHSAIGLHFSGRASEKPGWGLVSTYNGGYPTDSTWMDNSIFAIELKANGRVVRLAHTHSLYNEDVEKDYWAEPHASTNQDLTKIVFTSNWGRSGTEEVELYMIVLPADWENLLP
ncbi:MAG: hypothetical protein ACK2T7_08400 [Anaerolineales bacterium]